MAVLLENIAGSISCEYDMEMTSTFRLDIVTLQFFRYTLCRTSTENETLMIAKNGTIKNELSDAIIIFLERMNVSVVFYSLIKGFI